MKTFRRDKLLRLAKKGNLVLIASYSYDDMYGSSQAEKEMPVAVNPADWRERSENVCYLRESDFDSNCGRAWLNENGTVCLVVHSNLNYTFRILSHKIL